MGAHESEYGIGTRRTHRNCMNCGRFLPQVPKGWEIEPHGEGMDDPDYEYDILFHNCRMGALEMMIKRRLAVPAPLNIPADKDRVGK